MQAFLDSLSVPVENRYRRNSSIAFRASSGVVRDAAMSPSSQKRMSTSGTERSPQGKRIVNHRNLVKGRYLAGNVLVVDPSDAAHPRLAKADARQAPTLAAP